MATEKTIKDQEAVKEKIWGLRVHDVIAPVAYEKRSEAVQAIKEWKSRGWEFVTVTKLKEDAE